MKYPALQYKAQNIPQHVLSASPRRTGGTPPHGGGLRSTLQGELWGVRQEISGLICSEKGSG